MNHVTSTPYQPPTCAGKTAVSHPQPRYKTAVSQPKFHIRIDSLDTKENKFSIKMPLELFRVGLAIARSYNLRLAQLNWDDMQTKIEKMYVGALLDEQDEVRSERIQIFIEAEGLH